MQNPQEVFALQLPGCKSTSQRLLMLAATRPDKTKTQICGLGDGDDTRGLMAALEGLGARFRALDSQNSSGGLAEPTGFATSVEVTPIPRPFRFYGMELNAGPAGSTFRFLLPFLATGDTDVLVRATPRLLERPQNELYQWLRERGCQIDLLPTGDGLRIRAQGLPAGKWVAPTTVTSQFLSGLALASAWRTDVFVTPLSLAGVEAAPGVGYWALTRSCIELALSETQEWRVPSDPSAATFFLVALIVMGGRCRAPHLYPAHPETSLHEQLFAAGLLRRERTDGEDWILASGRSPLQALRIHLDAAPDAGPALAVLGMHLPAGLRLDGVERLRHKESDRLEGSLRLARHLGQEASHDAASDSLHFPGGGIPTMTPPEPYDVADDHRLAMAAGVASLVASSLRVNDSACVTKSFPDFWHQLSLWKDE